MTSNEPADKSITAILAELGMVKAELRAFRDLFIELHGKDEMARDALLKKWAAQAESYYATVDTDPQKVLDHAAHIFGGSHPTYGAGSKKKDRE